MTLDAETERLVVDSLPAAPGFDLLARQPVGKCHIIPFGKPDDGVTIGEVRQICIVVIGLEFCHVDILVGG